MSETEQQQQQQAQPLKVDTGATDSSVEMAPMKTDEQQQSPTTATEQADTSVTEEHDSQDHIALRSLVVTKEAGVVIGKGGKNVSEIRNQSNAKITISEMVPGAYDRVATVSGPLDHVAKAYALIARKILEESAEHQQALSPGSQQVQADMPVANRSTQMRLLVPNNRMGSVIGKAGAKIKEIQELSNARLVASEDVLTGSTERTITISGVPDSLHIAVYHVGQVLLNTPDRGGTVLYKPQSKHNAAPGAQPGLHGQYGHMGPVSASSSPSQLSPYSAAQGMPVAVGMQAGADPYAAYGAAGYAGMPGYGAPAAAMPRNPTSGAQSQQIFIPNDMVGCIIGKGGSKINEIRSMSGSYIKIAEPAANSTERLVTITGTPESNQMAFYMLYARLESEKTRMAANAASASASQQQQ